MAVLPTQPTRHRSGAGAPGQDDPVGRIGEHVGALMRVLRRIAGAHDMVLEPSAFAVLTRLDADGPLRSGEIAAATCADPSTISRQTAALVRAGLLERQVDAQDRRATLLALTDSGRDALDRERCRRAEHLAQALAGWPEADRAGFAELLARFVTDLYDHATRLYQPPPRNAPVPPAPPPPPGSPASAPTPPVPRPARSSHS